MEDHLGQFNWVWGILPNYKIMGMIYLHDSREKEVTIIFDTWFVEG